jgi:hypothetical protein
LVRPAYNFEQKNPRFGESGAHNRIRTGDLFLTKEVLYLLSYVGQSLPAENTVNFGAGNGIRTRDPQLGRLML